MKKQFFIVLSKINVIVAVCIIGCHAFAQILDSIWWYSAKDSPITIREYTPGGRYLEFLNISGKTIAEYDFGCVNLVNGEPRLENVFKTQKLSLKPLSSVTELKYVYYALYHDNCHNTDSKISVVGVLYENGSRWSVMDMLKQIDTGVVKP
ncbi:MAG TPA: hypothetical protein VKF63_07660 [Terracidiphilus sp.]|nr:hypothetical protein [Terracidiphilus sp.]